ncbi:DUF5686 and carboxypeptidase regulatory-like domain-containing protein [Bacteroides ihuae]|uniref:DUF5686 and carboxypeptidase regulatory-like domain-containing protein n=1 Tax=Bacteroides ihuae TaxID=1852362 RepID=UPI0008D9E3C3|nr:DUF5686 and carboxypeptidase regulatory-like domain-containing protein [Bacteroides ihuae]
MKRRLVFIVICILSLPILSQTFKGRVTDEKGNPIPYASLYLRELHSGSTTDNNGFFQMTLKPGRYICEISSIGFTQQVLTIQVPTEGLEQNIVLSERIYQLNEVSIQRGAEDPAYTVIRHAIARAPYYRTQLKSFTAGTYLKGTGKVKEIPLIFKLSKKVRKTSKKLQGKLFVLEEQREISFTAPNKWENHIKAYANSFPEEININLGLTTINMYAPELFGKVSPLSPGAFAYYRFKLDGCYAEGEHLVNKIRVIPKKNSPKLLSGYLYIIEDLWCISAAELSLDGGGLKATIKVTCKEVKPTVFLATSTSMNCAIDVVGIKAEASYLAAVHYRKVETNKEPLTPQQLTSAANAEATAARLMPKRQRKVLEQIEQISSKKELSTADAYKLSKLMTKSIELSDTLRSKNRYERMSKANETNTKTDSLAGQKDSLYWATVRSVPLRPEEMQSYIRKEKLTVVKDSLTKKGDASSSVAIGSSGGVLNTMLSGNTFRTKDKNAWLRLYSLASYIPEYNFVDGLWIGAKFTAGINLSKKSTLSFTPRLYYVTSRKKLLGSGSLSLEYAPRRRGRLTISGGVLSTDYNEENGESRLLNGISSLLFARNEVKLYEKRFLSLNNDIELANGLQLSASLQWHRRRMLDNTISSSLFNQSAKSNIPGNTNFVPMLENDLLKSSFLLTYTPAHYYRMVEGKKKYEDSAFPTFTLGYERAFPMSGGRYISSYHRVEFSAKQTVEFGMFNRLSWYANAGGFFHAKRLQFPDYKHLATTNLPFTERTFTEGFSLLENYRYSTASRWAQTNLMWSTPYLLLKHLPLLQRKGFDEALHLRSLISYDRKPYFELGYSVGFLDFARIGVFGGFDYLKHHSTGVSVSISLPK